MKKKNIVLIKYQNSGNIGSLANILQNIIYKNKLNIKFNISSEKKLISKADVIILPGVGHFDDVMRFLKKKDLSKIIQKQSKKKMIIGICIGMQVLFDKSEEGNLSGLKLIKGNVKKISQSKLPIIGWKKTLKSKNDNIIDMKSDNSYFYYLHSYEAIPNNKKIILMNSVVNNQTFAAFIKQKKIIGLQFHPELSSNSGFKILENILLKGMLGN